MTKKIIAIIAAFAMTLSLAACGAGNTDDTTTSGTTAAESETAETTQATDTTETASETDSPVSETETASETKADSTTAATTTVGTTKATKTTAAKKTTTGKATTTKAAAEAMPKTKAEIINYFNTNMNKVKTGAKKITCNHSKVSLNGSCTLPSSLNTILKLLGGADSFIGGQLEKNSQTEPVVLTDKKMFPVENETWSSKLTAADVKNATCTEKNGKYVISITTVADGKTDSVKHGQGHAPKAFSVILPSVVNDNIPGVATGIIGTATMSYPSSTVKVTIDPATGHVLKADYDLKWTINFDKVSAILPFATDASYTIAW